MKNRSLLILASVACILLVAFNTSWKHPNPFNRSQDQTAELAYAVSNDELSGEIDFSETKGMFEGKEVEVPYPYTVSTIKVFTNVLGATNEQRWIEVDLSEQKLRAWEGNSLFLETLVSTGLPYFPTPTGEFRIWYKTVSTRMKGGSGKYAYNLPNVPHTMFFENIQVPGWRGYGLHGAYWHNDFGTRRSHGCVNIPLDVAKRLFDWASPPMDGKSAIRTTAENLGTRVIIHE